MLIQLHRLMTHYGLKISGILHVGAHECEEMAAYNAIGLTSAQLYWVEAMDAKVKWCQQRYPNIRIFQGLIDTRDDVETLFHITNNGASSSILEFGSHATHHPEVTVIGTVTMRTVRLDTLIEQKQIPMDRINFLALDIQGVELNALKSMERYLHHHVKYIYSEVNTEEVYKGCTLMAEMDQYLSQFGFERAVSCITPYGWGDAFYMKKRVNG